MIKNLTKSQLLLLLFTCISFTGFTQISEGGTPYSFQVELDAPELQTVEITPPDLSKEIEEMRQGIGTNRAAKHINVDMGLNNSGEWTELPNGDRLWRLKVHSDAASGLYMIYKNFVLGKGAKLFVYNGTKENVLGAFTSRNNPDGGDFITSYTRGSTTILELFEPKEANSKLAIKQVGYMFNSIPPIDDLEKEGLQKKSNQDFGDAASCLDNINCAEGTNWQDEKNSVVRILFTSTTGAGWCTGTLMNNTNFDQTPYILTAYHCQDDPNLTLGNTIFYFRYEASGCSNPGVEPDNTQNIVGATEKSKWQDSDFALYELNQTIPLSYIPYFAGWDRRNIAASSGVAIHHSQGDIKKISTESGGGVGIVSGETQSTTFNFPDFTYQGLHYWYLRFDDGFTQGGASGGGLFNQDKRVVGQLLGGSNSTCSSTGFDLYGKIGSSWTNGTGGGLKPYLDPNAGSTAGAEFIDGFDGTIAYDDNVRVKEILVNTSPCLFTNSTEVEVEVQNFGQNPQTNIPVEYELRDASDNSLLSSSSTTTIGTLNTSETTTVTFNVDMANVGDYEFIARTILVGDENTADDQKLETFSNVKPTVGASNIQITGADERKGFTVTWDRGNGENVIVLVKEGSDFTSTDLPVDGDSYSANSIYGLGSTVGSALVVYRGNATSVNVSNLELNREYFVAVIEYSCVPEDYLLENILYSSEIITNLEDELARKIEIYPNPTSEYVKINFNDIDVRLLKNANIAIYTTSGKKVKTLTLDSDCKECELNTRDLANGTYILKINLGELEIIKKLIKE